MLTRHLINHFQRSCFAVARGPFQRCAYQFQPTNVCIMTDAMHTAGRVHT